MKLLLFQDLLEILKQEDLYISELLPFQKNSSLPSRVLNWIQRVEPKATPLPVVILQECLVIYIKKQVSGCFSFHNKSLCLHTYCYKSTTFFFRLVQVDCVGRNILSKLLYEWRLMDELGVLRAIYLLGSGIFGVAQFLDFGALDICLLTFSIS